MYILTCIQYMLKSDPGSFIYSFQCIHFLVFFIIKIQLRNKNCSDSVIPRLVLVMEPMFDFTIEEGEQLTIRCTIQNPESLVNIENGSLALTKGGSNLTRKLGIFELISFYTKVFLFKRNPFLIVSAQNIQPIF